MTTETRTFCDIMNIKPIMYKLGFNEKEVSVYLACLEHGPETITIIARYSGCKRSTLYTIIEGLLRKGFLVLVRKKQKTLYDAEKPKKLMTALRAREHELERALPELEQIRNARLHVPSLEMYEGEDGIRNVYDDIYSAIGRTQEVCFLTSVQDLKTHAPFVLENYFSTIKQLKEYRVRELIFDDEAGRTYVKELRTHGFEHSCRLLPASFPLFNDINIFGDKVAFFSFQKRSIAIVVENPEVSQSVKTLYEWAWKQGKEV